MQGISAMQFNEMRQQLGELAHQVSHLAGLVEARPTRGDGPSEMETDAPAPAAPAPADVTRTEQTARTSEAAPSERNGALPCASGLGGRSGGPLQRVRSARVPASATPANSLSTGAMSVEISRAPFDREPNTHGTRSKVARNISTDLASDENSRGSANATVAADAPPPTARSRSSVERAFMETARSWRAREERPPKLRRVSSFF